ncbi:geranylgeranyl reductase family protein [Methanothermobacter marburgensis]|uniref:Predicted dehydrogenase n=1 Tax=Methanothermobacter marburgensis (strain ATCC BAA-927 / DSM 2133 / JCM 14651 / NBRC 100331 / OCM 82 / Marburg) TaxID=79929 RepID=D9PWW7_METTM|nr:geranylgeranyl reductase family protein [Methanothermobacter marburgensis]ADL58715.1 predicted dehydrogenase [Methanothermobacter marburgensis str. Marburg]WBF09283.1 geranylgeranyl reductase family protein [Methanothermobacter marburgensis]
MTEYDVIIMGAGPAGSTIARLTASMGFRVGVLDRKKILGVPLQCAGLISHRITEANVLPDNLILNSVRGAVLHSPSGIKLRVSRKRPEAHVIDRTAYDQYLADLACEAGAELRTGTAVRDFSEATGEVEVNGRTLRASVLVDARGQVAIRDKYPARQFLVRFRDQEMDTDFVDLRVDSRLSPGFLWRIPLDEKTARVGAFGHHKNLKDLIKGFISDLSTDFRIMESHHGFIPEPDPDMELVGGRCIRIGDAAGQVKPTTGGGIVLASRAAHVAAEVIQMALEDDMGLLENYQEVCRKLYMAEMKNQMRVQRTFRILSDEDLDHIFLKMKEYGAEEIISRYGDMDIQTPLIMEFLKSGLLFRIIPSIISRKVASIWK